MKDGENTGTATAEEQPPRSILERLALACIALVVAALFGGIGVVMTLWAAASNLRQG